MRPSLRPLVTGLFAACLAAGAPSLAARAADISQIANLSGPDRQKILEDGARREGQLLWIGSFNDDNARPIIARFEARYPFIKVNRLRTDSTQAAQRVLLELKTKSPHIDLITSDDVTALEQAKAVQSFKSPALDPYPQDVKDPTGVSAPLYFIYHGIAAWNTSLVPAAQAPKSYEDLLDPKWKGRMTFAGKESGAVFLITFLRKIWGDAKAHAYLVKLAKQNVAGRMESARTVLSEVGSGEYNIMIDPFITHVAEFSRLGAPLAVSLNNPTPMSEDPMLLAKLAPHPYATMLMIDFLVGPQAQSMIRDEGYFPGNPTVAPASEMKPYLPETRGFRKMLIDDRTLGLMLPTSSAWYEDLFR